MILRWRSRRPSGVSEKDCREYSRCPKDVMEFILSLLCLIFVSDLCFNCWNVFRAKRLDRRIYADLQKAERLEKEHFQSLETALTHTLEAEFAKLRSDLDFMRR
jgi:hypothetical protein